MNVNKDILRSVALVSGGIALGSVTTYFLTRSALRRKFKKEAYDYAEQEIESVKETYKLLRKEPPYDDPKTAMAAYLERVDELQYSVQAAELAAQEEAQAAVEEAEERLEEAEADAEEIDTMLQVAEGEAFVERIKASNTPVVRNIWDKEQESHEEYEIHEEPERFDVLRTRDPNAPYVISVAEFEDDENEFSKVTITYFEGDDTLCDDRESIIPDIERTVGRKSLSHFGVDSDDKDIVYVRNEAHRTDYEVAREEGSYAKIVLGVRDFRDTVPKIRKMRDDE